MKGNVIELYITWVQPLNVPRRLCHKVGCFVVYFVRLELTKIFWEFSVHTWGKTLALYEGARVLNMGHCAQSFLRGSPMERNTCSQ